MRQKYEFRIFCHSGLSRIRKLFRFWSHCVPQNDRCESCEKITSSSGQALIILLVAAAVALSVLTAATLAAIGQGKASGRNELGRKVYYSAESGAEYALMKLMRNPALCTGTEDLTIGSANVTVSYSYNPVSGVCTVTSKASQRNVVKTISVQAAYNPGLIFNYSGWLEIQ